MSSGGLTLSRVTVRGFHFYRDGEKWLAKGVTYGPFRPDKDGDAYPPPDKIAADFDMMVEMGANTVRLYTTPTDRLARLAAERGLSLLVDVPWPKHLDVYGNTQLEKMCYEMVEHGVRVATQWPNVLGVVIGNEIPSDVARWATAQRVEAFLRQLYHHAKSIHPDRLVGFANFPSTEFLRLDFFDFLGFNVYLEDEEDLRRYIHRLRHLYPETPLLLSETGLDSLANGEEEQARVLEFSVRTAFNAGMAGVLIFSWTDEWHTGGYDIADWQFGLLDHDRQPKPSFNVARQVFHNAPQSTPLPDPPPISVVVATYNGARTLRECLESLQKLRYPDYEIIVVDDGSTDNTPAILADFPDIRTVRQKNLGLSAARNAGIGVAKGEIVAFTDSDCVVDSDWLHLLAAAMLRERCAGVGGPNLTPMEPEPIHRTVAYAPGHATHVLLSLQEAEHVPGCNMAFWRSELVSVGFFDPVFTRAGDDVDIIWRLQDKGERILFAPGAFVWHHRRSTIGAYLRQQMGYGDAEALLARKHPHRFNDRGQSLWRGIIYSNQELLPIFHSHDIHFGVFGSAGFQCIYERRASFLNYFVTSFEWWVVCAALLLTGLLSQAAFIAGLCAIGVTMTVSGIKAWRNFARNRHVATRYFPVVWLLWLMQPIVRGWRRYLGTFVQNAPSSAFRRVVRHNAQIRRIPYRLSTILEYWCEPGPDRLSVLRRLSDFMARSGWLHSANTGWEPWDLSVVLSQWFRSRVVSAEEDHGEGKRLLRLKLYLVPTSLFAIFALAGSTACVLIALQDTVIARIVLIALILSSWVFFRGAMKAQSAIAATFDTVLADMGYYILHQTTERDSDAKPVIDESGAAPQSIHAGKG